MTQFPLPPQNKPMNQVIGQFLGQKIQCRVLLGQKIQCRVLPGQRKLSHPHLLRTPYSMNGLFGKLFRDFLARFLARFWTSFLARKYWVRKYSVEFYQDRKIQYYSTIYYLLFTINFRKNPKIYFRYYIILFKIALNSLFIDQGVVAPLKTSMVTRYGQKTKR